MKKLIFDQKIVEFSKNLMDRASNEAYWYPVDRQFLDRYLPEILEFDPTTFAFVNFEMGSQLWAINLFMCLPEVWDELDVNDIAVIIENFTNPTSFYSLIEFTYKYIEIDILPIVFNSENVKRQFKKDLEQYLSLQWNNLLMTEEEKDEFETGAANEYIRFGNASWSYVKQRMLVSSQVREVKANFNELRHYISNVIGVQVTG